MTFPSRIRDERGSIAVEVAVIAPALLFLMLLVVYAGKVSEADGNVERTASDAARRVASPTPGDATDDARASAASNLAAAGVPCLGITTTVDTIDFAPGGGTVTVTVHCEASMADVTLLGVPGRQTFTATATEVIDTYRSGS
jgi:Flp pilus assembly protein TadG